MKFTEINLNMTSILTPVLPRRLGLSVINMDGLSKRYLTHKMGAGCAECSYELIGDRTRVTKDIFIGQAIEEHGQKYDYSKVEWVDQYTEVLIGCDNEEHGYFLQVPRDHKRGSGCLRCNESRGERSIFNWLQDNGIEFIPQHTFPGLKDRALLRCDFYLPNENIVIEYNGRQHYHRY